MCIFQAILNLVEPALPDGVKPSKFSVVLMFFLKIRLNLFDEDIGDRFGIHKSTVSRNFHRVLDIMAVKTAHLIKWPDGETLQQTMPVAFENSSKMLRHSGLLRCFC